MPKKIFMPIDLPQNKPDCCAECPLIGLVPKDQLDKGSYNTHICLATYKPITKRFSKIRASKRNKRHPLHRYCDRIWNIISSFPHGQYRIPINSYKTYRVPYIQKNFEEMFYQNFGANDNSEKQNNDTP